MKIWTGKYTCLVALLAGMSLPAFATNITANGGFESGDFTGWIQGGWFIDNAIPHNSPFEAFTYCGGSSCVSNPDNFLYQNLTTAIATTYALSFWFYNEYAGGAHGGPNEIQALVAGVVVADLINQPADNTYREVLVAFTATATSTRIEFRGRSDLDFVLLDDVCVDVNNGTGVCGVASTVPEPSSLFITGTGALAFLAFRRLWLEKRS